MLTIYSFPGTRGVRCTWAAEELGLEYDYKLIDLYSGEHRSPEYRAITPTSKVPAIRYGDVSIAESGAILSYLGDKTGKLIPASGTPERAYYEQAMYFVMTELEQPLWTMGKHKFAYPEEKRIPAALELGVWEFQQALKVFSEMLGDKTYMLGDEFSLADVAAGHTLSWARGFEQDIPQNNINSYADRVLERDALKRARKVEKEAKLAMASKD